MTRGSGWLRLPLAALACAGLAACMVGPDFKPPAPPEEKGYLPDALASQTAAADVLGGEAQRFVAGLDIPQDWWSVYRSRPLDDLVARSIRANPDIKAAVAALRIAQQNARAQRAALFPTVTVGATGAQSQAPQVLSAPTADGNYVFGLFTAFLNISYVIDVFGGVRRQTESLQAQAEGQCFLLEAAYLSLASNVVVAAITEASLRAQLDATRQSIELQKRTLGLLDRQLALGQAPLADVATQRAALAQTEAGLPGLEKQLAQQRHLLATLAGQTTANIPAETFDLASLQLPTDLPVSLPSRMVEQRPDIRAAEANLHAASAAIGVAVAAQLPQIALGTSTSTQSLALDTLFSPMVGLTSSVGGGMLQTLLDGGALQARTRAARAAYEQAEAQYRSTVLQAFRNVADTLRALEQDALALRVAVDAEKAAALSLQIVRGRLAAGDAGVLLVLNAELAWQQAVLARVQAQANRLADTAALYQALGGGWWNVEGTDKARRAECKPPPAGKGGKP